MRISNFGLGRKKVGAALIGSACGLVLSLSGCGPEVRATREWTAADHGQPSQAQPDGNDGRAAPPGESATEEEEGDSGARAARALWGVSCAGCHGRGGRGDGPTPPPGATMPDFTQPVFQQSRSDDQLADAIRAGRGLMPSFEKQLTPQAISALVGHIRTFSADAAAQPQERGALPAASPGDEATAAREEADERAE